MAHNWTAWALKHHSLTMPNPTVTVIGGTRDEFFENLRALRKQHPSMFQLDSHRVSPLILYGCAALGQRTEFVGDIDNFMSYLRRHEMPIPTNCLRIGQKHGGTDHGGHVAARYEPLASPLQ